MLQGVVCSEFRFPAERKAPAGCSMSSELNLGCFDGVALRPQPTPAN